MSAAELHHAVQRLSVLGSVLYVAAHPDDENTAFLTAMANGRHLRSAYLSMTRGEGGQNLLGTEQGSLLGMVRTHELLAARKIDGAEQFFTRAIDFGYSKTSKETLEFWGREEIAADVVRVIRRFRPDVIVTRFTSDAGTHGNHTSSAILAAEAFVAAGSPAMNAEQFPALKPWRANRIVWNAFRFGQGDRPAPPPNSAAIDLGQYDPILGLSYAELAGIARTMHKSQGFGAAQNRGEAINDFQHVAGDTARSDLFDGIDMTWSRIEGGEKMLPLVDSLQATFSMSVPHRSVPLLLAMMRTLNTLPPDPWVDVKRREISDVIRGCSGLWIDALSDAETYVRGESIVITLSVVNRSVYAWNLDQWSVDGLGGTPAGARALPLNTQVRIVLRGVVPSSIPISQPFWLDSPPKTARYEIRDSSLIGEADGPPTLTAKVRLVLGEAALDLDIPVRYRSVDPVKGEMYRPLHISPPVRVALSSSVWVFADTKSKPVTVRVDAIRSLENASVRLSAPRGWSVQPRNRTIPRIEKGGQETVEFTVQPEDGAVSGTLEASVIVDGSTHTLSATSAVYDHIPPLTLYSSASAKLLRIELATRGSSVGYIMGAGDEIPEGLGQCGYNVTLLSDDDLRTAQLSKFTAIVAGVRAHNTRPVLRSVRQRLLEYMRTGGTYLVQYVTTTRGESENIGPYPLTIGRERVTEEDAEMRILATDHPVVRMPNRITKEDFAGWVQERGLYYASRWSHEYQAILGSNDAGEPSRDGGLLVAKVGKGHFVYTGLALFRQIPAGVPGAYRMLANILSLSATK